jgi:hypothetical protein
VPPFRAAQIVGARFAFLKTWQQAGTLPVAFDCEEKHAETSRLSPYF